MKHTPKLSREGRVCLWDYLKGLVHYCLRGHRINISSHFKSPVLNVYAESVSAMTLGVCRGQNGKGDDGWEHGRSRNDNI